MKTILLKLLPGVAACLAVCLAVAFVRAQSSTAAPQPAQHVHQAPPAAVTYSAPSPNPDRQACPTVSGERIRTIVVCGNCGAQVAAPAQVLIAMPINGGGRAYRGERAEYAPARYVAPIYGSPGSQSAALLLEQSGYYERNGYPARY